MFYISRPAQDPGFLHSYVENYICTPRITLAPQASFSSSQSPLRNEVTSLSLSRFVRIMDAKQPEHRKIFKRIEYFRKTANPVILLILFLAYILANSPNHFKFTCATSLSCLYTLLLVFKDKVRQLEVEDPLEALKWRRCCICVVYAVSMVFEVFAFHEDIDRISRSFLLAGSKLMVLVPFALHCSFGEFEAVMNFLPGTIKELKGRQKRRVITHIMSFTPLCGFFLLTSVGNPWKLAYCGLSYLLVSLIIFSSAKANESKQKSLVLVKMWKRAENSFLIIFLILIFVVMLHIQPAAFVRISVCKLMFVMMLLTVVMHVVFVEMEMGNHFKPKDKRSYNGGDTNKPDSMRISVDDLEGNLTEILLFQLHISLSIIVVGLP